MEKKSVQYIHGVIKTNISDTAEECTTKKDAERVSAGIYEYVVIRVWYIIYRHYNSYYPLLSPDRS
jgi:hypothetical protein